MEWLLSPIDPSRAHLVDVYVSWHGRLMVIAWGMLFPLGVVIARFAKRLPWQDWPAQLDSKIWWYSHLTLQYCGGGAVLLALAFIVLRPGDNGLPVHALLGWGVVGLTVVQFSAGWLRGTKGGPTDRTLAGDHYDMTTRRKIFEYLHKTAGYICLMLAAAAILTGLWLANGPRWMWLMLIVWWAVLATSFIVLQRRGFAFDTYQAIWGPDLAHPGNRMRPIGWGVRRGLERRSVDRT